MMGSCKELGRLINKSASSETMDFSCVCVSVLPTRIQHRECFINH